MDDDIRIDIKAKPGKVEAGRQEWDVRVTTKTPLNFIGITMQLPPDAPKEGES